MSFFNARKLLSVGLAFLAVPLIFLGVGYIIADPPSDMEGKDRMDLSFLRTIHSTELNQRERAKPKTPPKVEKQPDLPKPMVAKVNKPQNTNLKMDSMPLNLGLDLGDGPFVGGVGAATGTADSDLVPIVKVSPQYPRQAALKGLEGFVQMTLDIKPDGSTTNVRVVNSNPRRVFDRAAVRAASKYKYKPPVKDGKPYAVKGHGVQIDFKIEGGF